MTNPVRTRFPNVIDARVVSRGVLDGLEELRSPPSSIRTKISRADSHTK